ncbi:unnamed protein product [Auanema sp. JU1783]|nr:unnamed protein product [Auanema sp. JU1783]
MVITSPCRLPKQSVRRFFFSPERPITKEPASVEQNTSNVTSSAIHPLPPPPGYLGYLSGAITSLLPKGSFNFNIGLPKISLADQKTTVLKTNTAGAPVKAVKADRLIERKISRTEVTNKTRGLVKRLLLSESDASRLLRIQDLSNHIMTYPPTRCTAAQESSLVSYLLKLEETATDQNLRNEARQCLTLCGHQPEVKSRGINLLTIDGGGTRGMMGLAILEHMEQISGKKIYELFDHVVGVSTGAIIATLLGVQRYSVKECRDIYMEISRKLFNQGKIQGVTGLIRQHSYYDTTKWIAILKQLIGEHDILIETSKEKGIPRLSIIASIVNLPKLEPYVFRNYEHPAGRDSHYRGGTNHPLWQAIQASAAAPFYFEEVQLGEILLQDGGVIANNPTAIAIHETKLLWPNESLHCVVSVGNGRSVVELEPAPTVKSTGVQNKLARLIDSATDTEAVHMSMHDLIDADVYYRLNPYMTYPYGLDEIDPDRLEQMQQDAVLYVRRNSSKIEEATQRALQKPRALQNLKRGYGAWRDKRVSYSPK